MRTAGLLLSLVMLLWGCRGEELPRPPAGLLESGSARAHGRELYLQHCSLCHGERADGRGVRRHALSGPPADFTSSAWRSGTSPGEIYQTIRDGVQGTSMAAFRTLSEEETWDLVAYLWSVAQEGP